MAKQLLFENEARVSILKGVGKIATAVKATLGPGGRNVILQKSFGSPVVTRDGVTVAKEIELEDPFENMGAKMVREVANKTNDDADRAPERGQRCQHAHLHRGAHHGRPGGGGRGRSRPPPRHGRVLDQRREEG